MIEGRVTAHREAVVSLSLRNAQGEEHALEAVIDTGYDGFLTVPPDLIEQLGLPYLRSSRALLGDGSVIEFDIHEVTVVWNDRLVFRSTLPMSLRSSEWASFTVMSSRSR